MNKKLILTDCDGVLLDWQDHYHRWMAMKGHKRLSFAGKYHQEAQYGLTTEQATASVDEFMSSAWVIGFPPFKDAVKGMARLADAGYRFHAITALDYDPYVKESRLRNLQTLFGDVFDDVTFSGAHQTKFETLSQEQFCDSGLPWIEDKADNAMLGADLGLTSYLLTHNYNAGLDDPRVTRVNDWNALCGKLLGVN